MLPGKPRWVTRASRVMNPNRIWAPMGNPRIPGDEPQPTNQPTNQPTINQRAMQSSFNAHSRIYDEE
eukprot:3281163-Prymnesium_polylepis.1